MIYDDKRKMFRSVQGRSIGVNKFICGWQGAVANGLAPRVQGPEDVYATSAMARMVSLRTVSLSIRSVRTS